MSAGQITVTEIEQVDFDVVAITTKPTGRVASSNLAARTAKIKVPAGSVTSQTVVTFTNKLVPKGFVQVCKKAATGDAITGNFSFVVAAGGTRTSVTVAVGACSASIRVPAGQATVTEGPRDTAAVTAIDVAPADRAVSSSVANRTATVKVVAGAATTQTVVTFTNKTVPPPTGTLRVCKVAGPGVSAGQEFTFMVGTATTTAKAGACSAPLTLPVGNVTVKETVPAGFRVSAIAVTGAGSLVSSSLGTATAVVKVAVGATDVNVIPQRGQPAAHHRAAQPDRRRVGHGCRAGRDQRRAGAGASAGRPADRYRDTDDDRYRRRRHLHGEPARRDPERVQRRDRLGRSRPVRLVI